MGRMKVNHWFTTKDGLSISLMSFYVKIDFEVSEDIIRYRLGIYDDSVEKLVYYFDGLDEAVDFTENVVNRCYETSEIEDIYNSTYKERTLKL